MREAARLQTFEDEFTFLTSVGTQNLTTNIGIGLDMIGEAVPPLLAEATARIAQALLAKPEGKEGDPQQVGFHAELENVT